MYKVPHVESFPYRPPSRTILQSLTATAVTATASVTEAVRRIGMAWEYIRSLPYGQWLMEPDATVKEAAWAAARAADMSWRKANSYLKLVAGTVAATAMLAEKVLRIGYAWVYDTGAQWLRTMDWTASEAAWAARRAADVSWRRANSYLRLMVTSTATATLAEMVRRIGIAWDHVRTLPYGQWLAEADYTVREAASSAARAADMSWRRSNSYLKLVVSSTATALLRMAIGRLGAWAYDVAASFLRYADYVSRDAIAQAMRAGDVSWRRAGQTFLRTLTAAAVLSTATLSELVRRIGIPWAYDTGAYWLRQADYVSREAVAAGMRTADVSWRKANTYLRVVANAVASTASAVELVIRFGIPWSYDRAAYWLAERDWISRESIAAAIRSTDTSWRRANSYLRLVANSVASSATVAELYTSVAVKAMAAISQTAAYWLLEQGTFYRESIARALSSSDVSWRKFGNRFLRTLLTSAVSAASVVTSQLFRVFMHISREAESSAGPKSASEALRQPSALSEVERQPGPTGEKLDSA